MRHTTPLSRAPLRVRVAEAVDEVGLYIIVSAVTWAYRNRGVLFAFAAVLALCVVAGWVSHEGR